MVKHCGIRYDKTSGKQCKYGYGYNYREGGTGFGCLSGDSCKVLPRTECGAERPINYAKQINCKDIDNAQQCNVSWTGNYNAIPEESGNKSCNWNWDKGQCEQTGHICIKHINDGTDDFCSKSSKDQWEACNKLDKKSCSKYGDGCKWTVDSASGGGTGHNDYPGCIVNCNGCGDKSHVEDCKDPNTIWTGAGNPVDETHCNLMYEVPGYGNTKLCIWDETGNNTGCNPGYEYYISENDRFCTRQKYSVDCDSDDKDDDGFCYTTGDID